MSDGPADLPARSESGAHIGLVVFDFDGVFTDNTVWTDESGTESVRCWRGDGLGLQMLRDLAHPDLGPVDRGEPGGGPSLREARCPLPPGSRGQARSPAASWRPRQGSTPATSSTSATTSTTPSASGVSGSRSSCSTPIRTSSTWRDYRTRTPGGFGAVREVCDWISASVRHQQARRPGRCLNARDQSRDIGPTAAAGQTARAGPSHPGTGHGRRERSSRCCAGCRSTRSRS